MPLRLGWTLRRGYRRGRRLRHGRNGRALRCSRLRNCRYRYFYRTRNGCGRIGTRCSNAPRCGRRLCQRLEKRQVTRLFRSRLHRRKRQIQLMFLRAGDPVQLPDQLIEFLRAAKIDIPVPQQPDGHHQHHRQSHRQRSQHNGQENRIEGSKRCIHRGPHCKISNR